MLTVGVNVGSHDSSVAIVESGRILCVVEEERLIGVKRAPGRVPSGAISSALRYCHRSVADVDALAFGWNEPRLASLEGREFDEDVLLSWLLGESRPSFRGDVVYYDHHLSHAASAAYCSGFASAMVLVADGRGEESSLSIFDFRDGVLHLQAEADISDSLGVMYSSVSEWCGLGFDDAGKLMGLAAYGRPAKFDFGEVVDGLPRLPFTGSRSQRPQERLENLRSEVLGSLSAGAFPYGPGSHIMDYVDVAASAQRFVSESLCKIVAYWSRILGRDRLALAGGVALNCAANGHLAQLESVRDLFVQPAAGDAGVSLGASILHQIESGVSVNGDFTPYLGLPMDSLPGSPALGSGYSVFRAGDSTDLYSRVCEDLAVGKIVGVATGRAEIGPRALGARSILAVPSPRRAHIRVNDVKSREVWRPLAPVARPDESRRLFEPPYGSSTMTVAVPVRDEVRNSVPAIVHIDGTARPQVSASGSWIDGLLERMVEEFGIQCLLNTSFNGPSEPIVHNAQGAMRAFLVQGLDAVVIGSTDVRRLA